MRIDYHTHTPLCLHATGEPEEYIARAVERKLDEIGLSDHGPMPPDFDPDFRMRRDQLDGYVASVRRARAKFPAMSVKLGLEADYHPGTESYVKEVLGAHDFDYVIGSVHYIGDWPMDNPAHVARYESENLFDIYRQYFSLVERLAKTGLYDILGHPDVVKKFGHRPKEPIDGLIRPALEAVKVAGMAMEINTSGLRRPCKEIYPSRRMLEIAFELGVPVTLGSDAHRPNEVGEGFDPAAALLASVGYTSIRRYTRRNAESVPL